MTGVDRVLGATQRCEADRTLSIRVLRHLAAVDVDDVDAIEVILNAEAQLLGARADEAMAEGHAGLSAARDREAEHALRLLIAVLRDVELCADATAILQRGAGGA
jgi:hypothetical protein